MRFKINKLIAASLMLTLYVSNTLAQQAETSGSGGLSQEVTNPMNYILGFTMVILISTILVLIRIIGMLTNQIAGKPASQDAETVATGKIRKASIWARLNRRFINDAVPVERERDVLLDHDYDGIKELDNNLPPWWKYGFYLTIFFAVIYLIQYHVIGKGSVQLNEYNAQLVEAEQQKQERLQLNKSNVDENSVTLLTLASELGEGQRIFNEKCVVCHGKSAEGIVGPNLTDDFWLHGGGIKDVFKTVKYGVPAKGMLAWQGQLTPVQIQQVSSFIKSLRGSNPANAKAPQGDPYTEQTAGADSTAVHTTTDSTATAAK